MILYNHETLQWMDPPYFCLIRMNINCITPYQFNFEGSILLKHVRDCYLLLFWCRLTMPTCEKEMTFLLHNQSLCQWYYQKKIWSKSCIKPFPPYHFYFKYLSSLIQSSWKSNLYFGIKIVICFNSLQYFIIFLFIISERFIYFIHLITIFFTVTWYPNEWRLPLFL